MKWVVPHVPQNKFIFGAPLPFEIVQHIYEFDPTYVDYFRKTVLPSLIDKAWVRIFCRVEGLTHRIVHHDNLALSLWFFSYNQEDWAEISDFEEEEEDL
jgi:hypothetical protein